MHKFIRILFLLTSSTSLFAEQRIDWIKFDYAPVYMPDNSGLTGLGDQVYESLSSCLPQYQHKLHASMSISRLFKKLNHQEGVHCIAALGTFPGQIDNVLYSFPVFTIPGSIIVVRKEDVKKFSADGIQTSFAKLYENENIQGAAVKDGTYGEAVEAILKNENSSFLYRSLPSPEGFYRMLLKNRFDYVLDYPIGFEYHSQKLSNEQQSKLAYLLLTENSDKPILQLMRYVLIASKPKLSLKKLINV